MNVIVFLFLVIVSIATLIIINADDKARRRILVDPPSKPSKVPPPLPLVKKSQGG